MLSFIKNRMACRRESILKCIDIDAVYMNSRENMSAMQCSSSLSHNSTVKQPFSWQRGVVALREFVNIKQYRLAF